MSSEIKKDNVYIFFGDSITYGLYDKEYGGWVNRVRLTLDNITDNNYIINLAIPGQTSNEIANRFEIEFKNRYNDIDNFNLIFSFGIKDSLLLNTDNNYIKTFDDNLNKIITISKNYTKKIYFVGLFNPNIAVEKRKNYNLDNVAKIDNCIEDNCIKNNIKYINLSKIIMKSDLCQDGMHPSSNGHKKISKIILKEIFNIK